MGRTLHISHPDTTWRDWLRDFGDRRDLLWLDPSFPEGGPACRLVLTSEGRVKAWRFVGTLDPLRDPLAWFSGAIELISLTSENCHIVTFPWRDTPVGRHLLLHFAQVVRPDRILVPANSNLARAGWIIGPEEVELRPRHLPLVVEASRRAQWLELLEKGEDHKVSLIDVSLVGSRLGSGSILKEIKQTDYAEVAGGVLLMVTERSIEDREMSNLMNYSNARKVVLVHPRDYRGLVCSFADQAGLDFGMGVIQSFDPTSGTFSIRAQAVNPAPIRILKLGLTRIDQSGKESFPLDPWTV
ncbi:MAG: hypothetical protein MUC92_06800 [Fimbriimonadaceae bacterium]|nr:hypothetical protein [Fimbriimonadaceae bacterium]